MVASTTEYLYPYPIITLFGGGGGGRRRLQERSQRVLRNRFTVDCVGRKYLFRQDTITLLGLQERSQRCEIGHRTRRVIFSHILFYSSACMSQVHLSHPLMAERPRLTRSCVFAGAVVPTPGYKISVRLDT